MHTDSISQTSGSGYAARPVTKAPEWHGLVAWDTLFNGMTTGLFLVAGLSELVAGPIFTPVAKVAYPAAFVLLLVDLMCLVLDLGDPLRFHHMLRVFKPSSPMSLGVWSLTIYSLPAALAAALSVVPEGSVGLEWVRKMVVVLGLLPALAAAVYKGVLFSTNAQPLWKDARWLGGYLTNSAFMLGCAELLVLSVLMEQERAIAILRLTLGLLLILNAIFLGLLLAQVPTVLARVYPSRQIFYGVALSFGGGVVLPLSLLLAGNTPVLLLAAVLLILLSGLFIRLEIVKVPHAP